MVGQCARYHGKEQEKITKRGPKEKGESYTLAKIAKPTTIFEYNQKEKESRRWATKQRNEDVLAAITN